MKENQVLIVKRRNELDAALLGVPGGHVFREEAVLKAVTRKLHEEAGILCGPICYPMNVDVIDQDKGQTIRFHFLKGAVYCDFFSGEPIA